MSSLTASRSRARRVRRLWLDRWQRAVRHGDCELDAGWLDAGLRPLELEPATAVVCGLRRELSPRATPYNLLCDIEWDTPIGEASACGGAALMRLGAFREVGGFDATLIAGEEPELSAFDCGARATGSGASITT